MDAVLRSDRDGPLRIAIISDAWTPQINGVVRLLATVKAELEARGHVVLMISPNDFTTVPCPGYPEIPLSVAPSLKVGRMLGDFRPQAVHIATEGPLGGAAKGWCRKRGYPFTSAYHTKFPEYVHNRLPLVPLAWLQDYMRRFHRGATAVLAPSHCVYDELVALDFANVANWSHGVDLGLFRPQDKGFLDLPRPIHMYVGRVAPEKNIPAFLDLDLPGSKAVVGPGPDRKHLMKAYPEAHFFLAANDAELARYYAAADVFVFPSLTDTFGLVMLEALASGVPVAAYPVTGPFDVFGLNAPGETEFGVLDDDLAAAARKALGKDPVACRERAGLFPWGRVVDELLAVLDVFAV